jgi:3-phenylpropionate/trans-cinnamate dioxygenase ferredoxin subunit
MADAKITMRPNGPYIVSGSFELTDPDGKPIPIPQGGKANVALCRCGGSTTKPFCDGTHSKIGFQGAIKAVEESGG